MAAIEKFPPELDIEFYKSGFPRLRTAPDDVVRRHYAKHGVTAGVPGSPYAQRARFLTLTAAFRPILEIGPYNKPIVSGAGVAYFDILDKNGLDLLAASSSRVHKGPAPHIDYVSPTGDLSVVDRKFAAAVSSHCIEHQPDLIKHLVDVGSILDVGGYYFILCPDKRYCFDHFIPESDIAAVLEAHHQRRRVHSLESIVRQRSMSSHNVALRHWEGDHGSPGNMAARVAAALKQHEEADGGYVDVHAWRFTPQSFREIMTLLYELKLSPLRPVRVFDTPKPRVEFAAILEKA